MIPARYRQAGRLRTALFLAAAAATLPACTWNKSKEPPPVQAEILPPDQLFEHIRTALAGHRLDLASRLIEENYSRFTDNQTADRLNFMRGWIAYEKADYPLARIWFEQIPVTNGALTPIALYYRAKAHEKSDEAAKAVPLYEKLIEIFPFSRRAVEARYDLAGLYFRQGQFEQALDLYEMIRRNPNLQGELYLSNRPAVLLNSGDALMALDRKTDALDRFESVFYEYPLSPEADVSVDRIVKLRQETGAPAFSADPGKTLGRVRRMTDGGRVKPAIRELEAVLPALKERGGRDRIDAMMTYAQSLERDRRYSDARTVYDQIAQLPGADLSAVQLRTAQALSRSNEDQAIQKFLKIAADFPNSGAAPDALYQAARFHHVGGRDSEAREIYQRLVDRYPRSTQAAGATFQMGWFDYLGGKYDTAVQWFQKASEAREDADEYERSLYWLGRSYEKSGNLADAATVYSKLWTERNWHYYGGLAKGRLDGLKANEIFAQMLPRSGGVELEPVPLRHEPELLQIAQSFGGMRHDAVPSAAELIVLGLFDEAADELDFIARGNPPDEQVTRLLPLFEETRDYQRLRTWGWNTLGKPASPEVANVRSWRALYPRAYLSYVNPMAGRNRLDARFILSIIREESAYDPRAMSAADAHGLMQLIPPTAEKVGRSLGLKGVKIEDLRDPETNIRLGSTYLRQLVDQFDGNMVFAIASYNGGPQNVNKWREKSGNLELDEFVEEIPFRETRNYVKKIFKSWSNYRLLYGPEGEQLYTLAMERMLTPPAENLSQAVHLPESVTELSGWVRPHIAAPPPVVRASRSDLLRLRAVPLSGLDDEEEIERARALESITGAVNGPRSTADVAGFDPAGDYQILVEDGDPQAPAPGPAVSSPIRLSDSLNPAHLKSAP